MNEVMYVNDFIANPKEFNGQRVVTFEDVDMVHQRAEGTAKRNFNANKKHFIEGIDYFIIKAKTLENAKKYEIRTIGIDTVSVRGTTFVTESGYLMLVKSFTDDLAWTVQRELVNNYFRKKEVIKQKREQVVDIPKNAKFQEVFKEMRKKMTTIDELLEYVNRHISKEEKEAYMGLICTITIELMVLADDMKRLKENMIEAPY